MSYSAIEDTIAETTTTSLALHHHLFIPARGGDPRTLVLLHGTGGTETSFLSIGDPIAADAAKLSLRGPVDENGMARFFRRRAEGVYDMDDLKRRTVDLGRFLAAAFSRYGRDPSRAIGIGYSNGANILANLAFTEPSALGAYALLHPLIPFDPVAQPALKGTPVLITSGARDPIAPAPMTAHLEDYFTSQGAKLTRLRHMGGHELRPEEIDATARFVTTLG